MSRKLTLDINFIDTPRDGDVFGYQISNNGVPLVFNGFEGWDKTFKEATDYTTANGNMMVLNSDLTPNTSNNTSIGNGFNGIVNVIKRQTVGANAGKYICVGGFTSYQGFTLTSRKICRLNTDFTLDTSFTPPDFPSDIYSLEIDSTDRIYIGGGDTIGGKKGICRLSPNGTQDTAYPVGIGFDRPVLGIKLQPDGKLIVTGVMTLWNGSTPCKGIIRLTTTGTKDATLSGVNQGFVLNNSYPRTIDLLSTGEIVVGGDFYSYNNFSCGNIIILTTTGAVSKAPTDLDNSPGGTLSENILKVLVDSTDKIYVTGKFERYGGGVACNKIIRLYKNGFNNWVPDLTFAVISDGLDNGNSTFTTGGFDMILNDSDNLVVVGNFGTVQGTTAQNIAVLDETGILSPDGEDTSGQFTSTGFTPIVKTISNLGDRFILGGSFNSYSNVGIPAVSSQFVIPISPTFSQNVYNTYDNLVEYNLDYGITYSVISSTVSMTASVDFTDTKPLGNVSDIYVIQPDDKAIIYNEEGFTGTFSTLIRINPNGTIDDSFNFTPIGFDIGSISLQSDNKLLLSTQDGAPWLYRLNNDGSIDTSFNSDVYDIAWDIFELSDNKIIINQQYEYIFRIDSDGLIDTSYGSVDGFVKNNTNTFNSVVKQTDDKILFSLSATASITANGGTFTKGPGIHRLNTDGTFDNTFVYGSVYRPLSPSDSLIEGNPVLKIDNNGKCMVNVYKGNGDYLMIRLNTDGSVDTSYNFDNYLPYPSTILFQSDNKMILFGGQFYDDRPWSRFNTDGSIDTTFNTSELVTIQYNGDLQSIKNYSNGDMLYLGNAGFNWPSGNNNITRLNRNGNEVLVADIDLYTPSAVRMEYTFDNDEIVVNSVYDTPDYVEITYTNESLTIADLIQEVVVRSPYLIITNSASFSSVNYKIRVYEGSIFTGPSQSVSYDIDKDKLFTGQSNIYININNLVRERLEANVSTFNDETFLDSQFLPENMSKWVLVDETIFDGSVTQSLNKYYLHALDGYLYNYEEQGSPNIFINGDKRYIHRYQPQRIYFQTNFLLDVTVMDEFGNTYNPNWESFDILGDNKKYIQSFQVDTYFRGYIGARPPYLTTYIDYIFTYKSDNNGDELTGRTYDVTQRFYIYDDCKYDLYTIVYKNKFGVLESIPFSRKTMKSVESKGVDYERSILDYNGNYDISRHTNKQYNVNGYESWILNTNWMPEYMNEAFEELSLTEEAWIIKEDGSIIPIVKEDTRIDFKTQLNDKLIQYTMKVKMSHQVIKNIL